MANGRNHSAKKERKGRQRPCLGQEGNKQKGLELRGHGNIRPQQGKERTGGGAGGLSLPFHTAFLEPESRTQAGGLCLAMMRLSAWGKLLPVLTPAWTTETGICKD